MSQLRFPGVEPSADELLSESHYLGPSTRARHVYRDDLGLMVFSSPASRHLPKEWLELARWCITGGKNAGSMQWARAVRWLRKESTASTVVSYSDPSVGHTGALYRACNWWWAPVWHRLVPPPSGLGSWDGGATPQAVKDRWVFPLRRDDARVGVLRVEDSYLRRFPFAEYKEPGGADYRAFAAARSVP